MATASNKAQIIREVDEGKVKTQTLDYINPTATDSDVAAVLTNLASLSKHTVKELRRLESRVITQ